MNAKQVGNLTGNLLVARDGFQEHDNYISKNIKSEGEDHQVIFRHNKDRVELIDVTKNQMLLDKFIESHDPRQAQTFAKEVYAEVSQKIKDLENKVTLKKSDEVQDLKQQQPDKKIEISKEDITKAVRVGLKQEGKIGADFGNTKNGIALARGDYIKLNETYSNKDGLLKSTEIPKGADIKITGYTTKKSEVFATGSYNNKEVEIKLREVNANYGDQYLKRYETNKDIKQAVDKTITNLKTDVRSQLASKMEGVNQNSPKLDKPSNGMKY